LLLYIAVDRVVLQHQCATVLLTMQLLHVVVLIDDARTMMTCYISQVFHQRLLDEFNMPVLLTTPNVPYTFVDSHTGAQQVVVNLGEWHSASTDSSGSSKRMVS
jgi:hypothetical protein